MSGVLEFAVAGQGDQRVSATTPLPVASTGANGTSAATTANPAPVAVAPNTVASSAPTSAQTATAAGSLIAKASAGNCYGFNVVSGATAGYFLLFNSATVPADGTVTPFRAYKMAADTSLGVHWDVPRRFSAGIVGVFSSGATPFTKTASATAFIAIDYV